MRVLSTLMSLAGLSACVSHLQYPIYVLNVKEQKLYAHDSKNDLPISVCEETPQSKANCYVILRGDYIRLRRDLAEKQK